MQTVKTVQTSWRPQLPLPKEFAAADEQQRETAKSSNNSSNEMERLRHSAAHNKKDNPLHASQLSNASSATNKKWSFGRLFRKKKEAATDSSSEEDRKAGFVPAQKYARSGSKSKSKSKSNRSGKAPGAGFDHIVPQSSTAAAPAAKPVEHELFLPVETVAPTSAQEPYYHQQSQQQQQLYLSQAPLQQQYSRSSNSLDRRAAAAAATHAAHKSRSTQRLPHAGTQAGVAHTSSEEELISLNSSTFSKYRSDESIHSGGQGMNGQSRRSRAARNERYYKRLSRDGEVSNGQVPVMYAPQPAQRWKTQPVPLSIYNGPPPAQPQQAATHVRQVLPPQTAPARGMRNTSSLQHVAPYVQWGQVQQQQQPSKQLQNSMNDAKRSISYDSHIHLQNAGGRLKSKPLPPPPPPRDPLRRVNVSAHMQNGSSGDLRPLSYAFDKNGATVLPASASSGLSGRCVSDDKIWAGQMPHYRSAHSLNTPSAYQQHATPPPQQQRQLKQQTPPIAHSRRFITRAERDALPSKQSLPNGIDLHYVADTTPRSRKPVQLFEAGLDAPPPAGVLRTTKSGLPSPLPTPSATDYWKRLDGSSQRRGREVSRPIVESVAKPRSISSSRACELRSYPIPMYSEIYKPNRKPPPSQSQTSDEPDSVVCGSLHIKPGQDNASNYVEIRHKDANKSSSMPNHYQRRSAEVPTTPNKYDEYVAEKRELHNKPIFNPPTPPQRKLSIPPSAPPLISFPRKKPANLEEAINELEAIYKSLGLSEAPAKQERIPTPSEFEKFALAHAAEYDDDDDDSPTGEPDPVRDDVAYRNMQLANLQHKTVEKQPPFGIPIGPIVPAPQTDYLHVTPTQQQCKLASAPDVIKDDLAVRALRKDPPGPKERFMYPTGCLQKKHRATRTQSANIYSLIQRDAAKPSGGDLYSFMELSRSIDRSGSMTDLHKGESTAEDIPATLTLLRNLKEQEQQAAVAPKKVHIPFRHPSQGGAICQLPEKLASPSRDEANKPPVPLPRKSLTPEPLEASHQMDDALNKIAKDAQESSVKLSKELQELRKGALITAARAKVHPEEQKLEKDLQEIEAVSEAAKRCGKMLLDTLPDANTAADASAAKPRKLHKEGKLIEAIDQVSEAANAVCEKILKDIVTTEPPVVVHEAVKVKSKPQLEPLVMPNLIKKLDPIQSEKIEAIAKRCMRQLSELAESPDYDNLANPELQPSAAAVACNTATSAAGTAQTVDSIISTLAELQTQSSMKPQIEEIDKIMQECEAKARSQSGNSTLTEKPPAGAHAPHSSISNSESKSVAPSMTASSSSSNAGPAANAANSSTTASSFSSSSDCLAKSSSPSASRRLSSSITSFNPYSSSDYIKSPSSEYHAPSTDPIKTFSTTSYDQSTSATPNITTNSTFSYSPSPPLNLTPKSARARTAAADPGRLSEERARSSSPSQYNSSEELAMIFGIEEQPKQLRRKSQQQLELQQQQKQQQQQSHISGKLGASIHHASNVPLSSSNHALCAATADSATATACLTNPKAACEFAQPTATNPACLNVVVVVVDDEATCSTSNTNTTTTNTNTNCTISSPTTTNASPTSCKLETIPEILLEQEQQDNAEQPKLSPNFNRLYASKISIIMDRALQEDGGALTQCDSLSSLEEETCSNPDSGNVSLADFPLSLGGANACLQLQTTCNSRYEVRSSYVCEVRIPHEPATAVVELNETERTDFPPPPTAAELLNSLREEGEATQQVNKHSRETDKLDELNDSLTKAACGLTSTAAADAVAQTLAPECVDNSSISISADLQPVCELNEATSCSTPARKSSIVYETPQLNMSITELRLNYASAVQEAGAGEQQTLLSQIKQCTAEVEQLNEALNQMPRRRNNRSRDVAADELDAAAQVSANDNNNTGDNSGEKPTSSAATENGGAVSLLGELRPANSLTLLEQVLVACSLGVISPDDLFTLCLIVIAVITIMAFILF